MDYSMSLRLHQKAHTAGMAAGNGITPSVVTLVDEYNERYSCAEGPCGFAWIKIKPANCRFANFLKFEGIARTACDGGVNVWVHQFNQSMERKEAYARAYAQVLRDAGMAKVYVQSRMD